MYFFFNFINFNCPIPSHIFIKIYDPEQELKEKQELPHLKKKKKNPHEIAREAKLTLKTE